MALLAFVNTHTTFDGFVLPNILNKPMQGASARLRLAETPNRPGEYTAGGKRASGKLSVIGRIVLSSGQSMDDAWRELVVGLPIGTVGKLATRQDDTSFRWAEVETLDPGDVEEGSSLIYQVGFSMADPFEYAAGLSSALRNSVGTVTANNAGALATPPSLEVIVASVVGANPTATITNSTTGKALVINPAVAATYTLDHRLRTITKSTGGDARTDLSAASEFWDLASGSNTITVAASNCTVGDTTISWRSRWA